MVLAVAGAAVRALHIAGLVGEQLVAAVERVAGLAAVPVAELFAVQSDEPVAAARHYEHVVSAELVLVLERLIVGFGCVQQPVFGRVVEPASYDDTSAAAVLSGGPLRPLVAVV